MLILGTDTSGPNGSIALVRFDSGESQTVEIAPIEGGTFSAQLIPQVAQILKSNNLAKRDIDALAVASGPGSFTGLRVGLAAVKALAETLHKPIAAVSLLEVIASEVILAASTRGQDFDVAYRCVVILDARRNEVFAGEYEVAGRLTDLRSGPRPPPTLISESLCTVNEIVERANRFGHSCDIFTPDSNLSDVVRARMQDPFLCNIRSVSRPDASSIARLGWKKIRAGRTVSAIDLDANYIRRSDAEIKASTVLK